MTTKARDWILFDQPEGGSLPKWMRTACVEGDDVWLPAASVGDELALQLCAGHDGAASMLSDGHLFLKASYLEKMAEEKRSDITADDIRRAAARVRTGNAEMRPAK